MNEQLQYRSLMCTVATFSVWSQIFFMLPRTQEDLPMYVASSNICSLCVFLKRFKCFVDLPRDSRSVVHGNEVDD